MMNDKVNNEVNDEMNDVLSYEYASMSKKNLAVSLLAGFLGNFIYGAIGLLVILVLRIWLIP